MKDIFEEIVMEPGYPLTKYEALCWMAFNSEHGGVFGSERFFAEKWRWSKYQASCFLADLTKAGHISIQTLDQALISTSYRKGRLTFFKFSQALDRALIQKTSHVQALITPIEHPVELPKSEESRALNQALNPPSSSLGRGDFPPLRGENPPRGEKIDLETNPIAKMKKGKQGNLKLLNGDNYEYAGDNIKITKAEYGELCKTYAGQNVMAVARYADKVFPQRKNKNLDGLAYLEGRLMYADRDRRDSSAELACVEPGDEKKNWWRSTGANMIKAGHWNDHLTGKLPWEKNTQCPPGTFTERVLRELKEEFNAAVDRKRVAGRRHTSEEHLLGGSQDYMPKLH